MLWKFLLLLTVFVSGCSTTPTQMSVINKPGIAVARDTGLFGSGCLIKVDVNKVNVASLESGNVFRMEISPGLHVVRVWQGDGAGAMGGLCTNISLSQKVEVIDRTILLRVGLSSNLQMIFDEVD